MPMYDRKCTGCGAIEYDVLEPIEAPASACNTCGSVTERAWLGRGAAVVDDSIPGGLEIKHGLCHPDGTPRRFDSKSEIAREAKRTGWVNYVVHEGSRGSDKSKHTSRWI